MKGNPFSILLLAVVTLFGACSEYELNNGQQNAYDPAKVITFTAGIVTRGTPINDVSDMTDMGVFCSATGTTNWNVFPNNSPNKMFNSKLTRNSTTGAWEYNGTPEMWNPITVDDHYTFFAYAPYEAGVYNSATNVTGNGIVVNGTASTAGIPTLTYTIPTDVTKQPDLMVAIPKYDLRYTGQPVPLQMEHALTCIGFKIAGSGEEIIDISIEGVSMTATLAMNGGVISWTDHDTPVATTSFSASLNPLLQSGGSYTTTSIMTDIIAGNGYLMMIPQTLTSAAKLIITKDDNSTVEFSLDTYEWEAGKKVVYNVNVETPNIYIGMFGGELVKDANGAWQFERPLYLQEIDNNGTHSWQQPSGVLTNITNNWDGKANTLALNNLSSTNYPAANLCFQKNTNYSTIGNVNSPNYIWFLPAQKQLMAIWAVHNSFNNANKLLSSNGYYWSSTENNASNSWIVRFVQGYVMNDSKTTTFYVRCVKEL